LPHSLLFFLFYSVVDLRDLHSFPTRRSSDLSTVDNSMPDLCAGAIQPNPGTGCIGHRLDGWSNRDLNVGAIISLAPDLSVLEMIDRKSTRLNSSHSQISYAVFCLKKKKIK